MITVFSSETSNASDHVKLKAEITVIYNMYILGNANFVIFYLGLHKLLAPP